MKRGTWIIIVLTSGVLLLTALTAIFIRSGQTAVIYANDGADIGYALLRGQAPTNLVYIGSATTAAITAITPKNPVLYIEGGDDPDYGDGKADYRIIYRADNRNILGLRLKRATGRNYEILGFWTPRE
jgi:hypothetical protein